MNKILTFNLMLLSAVLKMMGQTMSGPGIGNTASNTTICPNQPYAYTLSPMSGPQGEAVSYQWSIFGGGGNIVNSITNNATVSFAEPATSTSPVTVRCTWSYMPQGGSTPLSTNVDKQIYVVFLETPLVNMPAPVPYGITSNQTFIAQTSSFSRTTSITWTKPAAWAAISSLNTQGNNGFKNTSVFNVTANATGDGVGPVTASATYSGCPSFIKATGNISLSRITPSIVTTASVSEVCTTIPTNLTVYVNGGSGVPGTGHYIYTAPTGFSYSGQNPFYATYTSATLSSTTSSVSGNIMVTAVFPASCQGCTSVNGGRAITAQTSVPIMPANIFPQQYNGSCLFQICCRPVSNATGYNWGCSGSAFLSSCAPGFWDPNTTYSVSVRAHNACGYSSCKSKSGTTPPPPQGCMQKTDETNIEQNYEIEAEISNVSEDIKYEEVEIFPVPSSDKTIFVINPYEQDLLVRIFDVLGKEVFSGGVLLGKQKLQLNNLNAGIYFVRTEDGIGREVKKIMLQ